MIAHGHPLTTTSADDQPLKQGWPFARGTVAAIFAVGGAILSQLAQVRFILLPADVARMGLLQEKRPLLLWDRLDGERAVSTFAGVGASIAEGASVAGIAQHLAGRIVDQRCPMDLAFMWSCADTARKQQPLVVKELHGPPGRPYAFESGKQQMDGLLDLGVRVQDHAVILSVDQAHRQRHLQGTALRLVENPTA